MDPITFGTIAMGVGDKMFGSLVDTGRREEESKALMRRANLMQSSLEENMRRAQGAQTQIMSSTKARMAGSGLEFDSGTFMDYLNGLATEFQKTNAFERKAAEEQISETRQAGAVANPNPIKGAFQKLDLELQREGKPMTGLGLF